MSEDPGLTAFRLKLAERGLALADDDVAELYRGWRGLQPQLERLRRDLPPPAPGNEPPP